RMTPVGVRRSAEASCTIMRRSPNEAPVLVKLRLGYAVIIRPLPRNVLFFVFAGGHSVTQHPVIKLVAPIPECPLLSRLDILAHRDPGPRRNILIAMDFRSG